MLWIALLVLAAHLAVWFGVLGPAYRKHSSLVPLLPPASEAKGPFPPVCACVPARNEEAFVEQAVRSLLAQDYPALRVVVADDHSTDRTPAILQRLLAEDGGRRLEVLRTPDLPEGWMGKCHAVHHCVRRAPEDTELFLFCDADVIHEPTTLRRAVHAMREDGADLLGLSPRLDCIGFWENAILPMLIQLGVCKLNPEHFNDPSRNEAVAIGAFALVRRDNYESWGGHEAIKGEVIDDLAMGMMAKRAGGRLAFLRDRRAIHLRMYSNLGEIMAGFRKNIHTALGGSALRAAGFAAAMGMLHWGPLAAIALLWAGGFPGGAAPVLLAVAAHLATGLALVRRMGMQASMKPMQVALGFPLGAAAVIAIIARSTWMGCVHGVVEWRGRTLRRPEQKVQIF